MLRLVRSLVPVAFVLVPALPLSGHQGGKDQEDPLPAAMKFVKVPKGTFWMGWTSDRKQSKEATIKEDFELAAYTVTQRQWQGVMGTTPSFFSRQGGGKNQVKDLADEDIKHLPVEDVSWNDAQQFIAKVNEREKGKGWTYRLPTEAEWEYACRGAATSREECSFDFYLAQPTNDLSPTQANFDGTYPAGKGAKGPPLGRTAKVGSYAPNKLGLHDMHGNVWQWCSDRDEGNNLYRVIRGGSWSGSGGRGRAADRRGDVPSIRAYYLGFRLARVPSA